MAPCDWQDRGGGYVNIRQFATTPRGCCTFGVTMPTYTCVIISNIFELVAQSKLILPFLSLSQNY